MAMDFLAGNASEILPCMAGHWRSWVEHILANTKEWGWGKRCVRH